MGIFSNAQQANSAACGRIVPNFKLVRDIIAVLHTYKNETDPFKHEGTKVLTRLYNVFFRRSRAAKSDVSGGILPKFKIIQAFMVFSGRICRISNSSEVLWLSSIPARIKKIRSKMKALEC